MTLSSGGIACQNVGSEVGRNCVAVASKLSILHFCDSPFKTHSLFNFLSFFLLFFFLVLKIFRYLAQIPCSISLRDSYPSLFFFVVFFSFKFFGNWPKLIAPSMTQINRSIHDYSLGALWVVSGLNITISIHTRCLSGGFWPKYCGYQSALGAFRVASGLNNTTFNPH